MRLSPTPPRELSAALGHPHIGYERVCTLLLYWLDPRTELRLAMDLTHDQAAPVRYNLDRTRRRTPSPSAACCQRRR
jgi:hypothetical protein